MQKVLAGANIKLAAMATDIMGGSGRDMSAFCTALRNTLSTNGTIFSRWRCRTARVAGATIGTLALHAALLPQSRQRAEPAPLVGWADVLALPPAGAVCGSPHLLLYPLPRGLPEVLMELHQDGLYGLCKVLQ